MTNAATVLFARHLKLDAAAHDGADRDRYVLSAGHGSMLPYGLLHLTGYPDMTLDQIKRFRQLGSIAAGHPEYGHAQGIETTTGPLGQGLANAVGMAMAEAHLAARFGSDLVDHHTRVIAGDGCLMEGISQEAIGLAGTLTLKRLIMLWDDNNISIDGAASLSDVTNQKARFEVSDWRVLNVDGHDIAALDQVLADAQASDRPTLIACKTTIGYGAPKEAGAKSAHGEPLGAEELAAAEAALAWPLGPIDVPKDLLDAWRAVGSGGGEARAAWTNRLAKSAHRSAFEAAFDPDLPEAAAHALTAHAAKMAAD